MPMPKPYEFMTKTLSAWDARLLIMSHPDVDFQLAAASSDMAQNEVAFHMDVEPGEPTSPVIIDVGLSPSGMYVEFRFRESVMYMTVPAMTTVTLGWLQPVDAVEQRVRGLQELLQGDPWHLTHRRHESEPPANT